MTHTLTPTRIVLSVSALALITGALLSAGPLNPPAGPVTSTYKTLTEVEPRIAINATNTPGDADSLFKVSQPGSYYLTGNITGVVGKHGVEIASSGVTLDLNGFDLLGAPGSLDGVTVIVGSPANITVMNGSVRSWGGDGVDLQTAGASNSRVAAVNSSANGGHGILVAVTTSVDRCACSGNVASGITTQSTCVVTGCSTRGNQAQGIVVGNTSTVAECVADFNTGIGISADRGSALSGCTSQSNGSTGFFLNDGSTATNCAARTNAGDGVSSSFACVVTGCAATSNTGHGISVASHSSVTDCAARSNTGDGIRLVSGCTARHNTCASNGSGAADGAGIHAVGSDCLIQGNNCVISDRGIDVDNPGNIIFGNTCAGNTTDWVIVANNVVGPIVDRRAPASAAINGFTAPDSTGSTHPNANFSY
ncbi:MAG: right-handed parallel beta-helix repeat-containing protein [Planctomycetota bacterium]